MSLYSRIFAENPHANELLAMIGYDRSAFGRFRDIFPSATGRNMHVYARVGDAARPYFRDVFRRMQAAKAIITEDGDPTYVTFTFFTPEQHLERARELAGGQEPLAPTERFKRFQADLEAGKDTPETRRSKELEAEVAPKLREWSKSNDFVMGIWDTDMPEALRVGPKDRRIEV